MSNIEAVKTKQDCCALKFTKKLHKLEIIILKNAIQELMKLFPTFFFSLDACITKIHSV